MLATWILGWAVCGPVSHICSDGVQHPRASFFFEKTSRNMMACRSTALRGLSFSPSLLCVPKLGHEAEGHREWGWLQGDLWLEKSPRPLPQSFLHAGDLLGCSAMVGQKHAQGSFPAWFLLTVPPMTYLFERLRHLPHERQSLWFFHSGILRPLRTKARFFKAISDLSLNDADRQL